MSKRSVIVTDDFDALGRIVADAFPAAGDQVVRIGALIPVTRGG